MIKDCKLAKTKLILNSSLSTDKNQPTFNITSQKVDFVQIDSLKIPISYYNVTSANNTINWTISTPSSSGTTTITPGNYNITELMTAIDTALTSDTKAAWSYTIPTSTYKVALTIAAGTFQFTAGTTIGTLIGFTTIPLSSTGTTYTAPSVYNEIRTKHIYIRCTDLVPNRRIHVNNNPRSNILDIFPVIASRMTISYAEIFFENPTPIDCDNPTPISSLTIDMLDDNFTQLDLNGLGFTIGLTLIRKI